ncbi:hypothetical protein MTO96_045349 [Rhipicephalus appendiculatus]
MDAAETEELVGGRREAPKPRLTPLTSSPISAAPTGNKDKGPTKVPPMTSTQDITTPAAKEQMPENMDTSNTSKRTREEAEGKKANEIKASEEPPAKAINVRRKPTPNVLSERRIAETQPPSHLQQQQPLHHQQLQSVQQIQTQQPPQQPLLKQQTLQQRQTDQQQPLQRQKGPSAEPPPSQQPP